jgi:hypothetical protein
VVAILTFNEEWFELKRIIENMILGARSFQEVSAYLHVMAEMEDLEQKARNKMRGENV